MELKRVSDLFLLPTGETFSKRNLFDLIQLSKVEGSQYWSGPEWVIGNTPQQGINWIGHPADIKGVIIKTRPGAYEEDGWSDESKTSYHYSFKARNNVISYTEKANAVLIRQPQHLYPILLFIEQKDEWLFEGVFSVSEIESNFVVLHRRNAAETDTMVPQDDLKYYEGERKYVTHLMAERNRDVVRLLKETNKWTCDICGEDFFSKYGVEYIEAHHKTPISTFSHRFEVSPADFALLCPNCHKAVHIYMKTEELEYEELKERLSVEQAQ